MNDEEFWAALSPQPEPTYTYRLYYDEQGLPLFYSMENLPGKYIEIDQAAFVNSPTNVRVVDKKLLYLKSNTVLKLHPSRGYGTPCYPTDVSIVVDPAEPHTKWILK